MSSPFIGIRNKLFKEKRYVRYIAVAFVEVILIVFGILLALEIDNWNNKRISEKKINRLLSEIKLNLSGEIEDAEHAIVFLNQRDSIIQTVKEKTVTRQDFASPTILSPQYAILTYTALSINKDPYENLVQISNEIPTKYDLVYDNLKTLYGLGVNWMQEREEKLLGKVYPFQDDMRRNKPWWSDVMGMKELDDDAINYFLFDQIYLNWVYEIDDDLERLGTAIEWYRNSAIELVKQINDLGIEAN